MAHLRMGLLAIRTPAPLTGHRAIITQPQEVGTEHQLTGHPPTHIQALHMEPHPTGRLRMVRHRTEHRSIVHHRTEHRSTVHPLTEHQNTAPQAMERLQVALEG